MHNRRAYDSEMLSGLLFLFILTYAKPSAQYSEMTIASDGNGGGSQNSDSRACLAKQDGSISFKAALSDKKERSIRYGNETQAESYCSI